MTPLRPYQEEAVRRILCHPRHRQLYAHTMGSGKSRTAIESAKALGARKIAVVCPAAARPTWMREFAKWSKYEPHSILHNASRTTLSKKDIGALAVALEADVQVVSFALVKNLSKTVRDLLIVDECHRLAEPSRIHSRAIRGYMEDFPLTALVLLSGTPAPTELKQMWHQLHLLEPGIFGPLTKQGGISWKFLDTYCNYTNVEISDGETRRAYFGGKNLEAFRAKTEHLVHRVTEADLAAYLPPVRTAILWQDTTRAVDIVAAEWLETLQESDTHFCLIAHHHKEADKLQAMLAKNGYEPFRLDGTFTPEQRQMLMDQAASRPTCAVVATSEAVSEAIDLSFCRRALIFEFSASPGRSAQLLRRFARAGSAYTDKPTTIEYVAYDSDSDRAEQLQERLQTLAAGMTQDAASADLQRLFVPRELTTERLDQLFLNMLSRTHLSLLETSDE